MRVWTGLTDPRPRESPVHLRGAFSLPDSENPLRASHGADDSASLKPKEQQFERSEIVNVDHWCGTYATQCEGCASAFGS